MPVSTEFECLKEYFLFVKIRSIQEPFPLKQVLNLIKFIKPLAFIKSFIILSVGWLLKSPITIKLSYELEEKSIMFVKESRKQFNDSKGGPYIDITNIFSFLKFNSNGIACIL